VGDATTTEPLGAAGAGACGYAAEGIPATASMQPMAIFPN